MNKFAFIATVLFLASLARGAEPTSKPTSKPSLSGLIDRAKKHEAAGRYSQAARSARAALALTNSKTMQEVFLLRGQLRRLARRQCSARRLTTLAGAMKARPDDLAIREKIINICILELDNPALAATFVNEDTDQILQTYVPMAAKNIDQIPEAPCRELAEWYLNNLKKPSRSGRIAMLRRVAAYYGRFLKFHKDADAERLAAAEKHKLAVRQLADLGETAD